MRLNYDKPINFKSALVTGGGGFLGYALVKALVDLGVEVTTIQRNYYQKLEELKVKQIVCDLFDIDSKVLGIDKNIDVVFHTAAKVSMWGSRKDFVRTNVESTQKLVALCRQIGIQRFIYTSSPSVIANGTNLINVNESIPYPSEYSAFYPKTKAMAEKFVLSQNQKDFWTLSLRPHLIYGPGDTSLEALVVKKAKAKKLIQVGDGKNLVDFCYIDDCVRAHLDASIALLSNPASRGRAYFISQGEPVKLWEWINVCLKKNNLPPIKNKIPANIAVILGSLMEKISLLSGNLWEPPFTKFLAQEMSLDHYFDISCARKELGYEPQKKDILNW